MDPKLRKLLFILITLVAVPSGCGNKGDSSKTIPPPEAGAKSALEYADKALTGRMLGGSGARYRPGSAKDAGGGKFQFQDTAGANYEVTVTSEGEAFKMTDPQPVK